MLSATAGVAAQQRIAIAGIVINDRGKPVSGAYVFACDARDGVKVRDRLVVAGPAGPKDPVCGGFAFTGTHAARDGSFALAMKPAPHLIVTVQDRDYPALECAYWLRSGSLRLHFILQTPRNARERAKTSPACPAAS